MTASRRRNSAPPKKLDAWEGRITVVVSTTPEIDRTRVSTQALGERFVMVRWRRAGVEGARKAILQDPKKVHADVRAAVHGLLTDLPSGDIEMDETWQDRIVKLAEISVRGRTNVNRNPTTKEMEDEPQPESATRLAQQLCQLAKGSARLDGREAVSVLDFELIKRVSVRLSSASPQRDFDGRSRQAPNAHEEFDHTLRLQRLEALGLLRDNELSEEGAALFEAITG